MEASDGSAKRAEVLSNKKIPAGLCCLAVVRKAEKGSVSLYLPHGLHAVAKAADVNPVAGMLCLPGAKSAESDSDSDASHDDERVVTELSPSGLSALLVPGQYVSCVVLRTPEAAAGQAATEGSKAPPLSVSMHPTLVNDGLDFSHLTKDVAAIWGFVVSKEDHGFVVELGVSGVHAFLPFKNVVGGPASLLAGSPAFFSITAVKTSAHSVVLSYDPSKRDHVSTSSAALSLTSLKPGTLVNATVKKVLRNGLFVSFLDFFQGTVDLCHLPVPASAYWASAYEKAQSLRCRVLFVNLSAKVIGLSAAPHITSLSPITFEAKYGDVIDPATIVRVDAGVGVTLSFAPLAEAPRKKDADALNALCAWGTTAFCHVSRLSDSRVEYVERSYSVGAVVNCRVVGFSPLEALVNVSMQPSVLKAAVLSYAELSPGQQLTGTVSTVDDYGVLVALGQGIRGLVTTSHLSDLQATSSSKKSRVKVGATVKVRVLEVNAAKRRCTLTMKRSLLESTLPVVTSYEQAAAGAPTLVVQGFVTTLRPSRGITVTFYNNVHGVVSEKELQAAGMGAADACAHMIGSVLKVRVVSVNLEKRTMVLSLRLSTVGLTAEQPAELPSLGSVVSGTVASVSPSSVVGEAYAVIRLSGAPACHGKLPLQLCGDSADSARAAFDALKAAQKLPELLVFEQHRPGKNDGYPVTLCMKPLLLQAVRMGTALVHPDVSTTQAGSLVAGFISATKDFGVFVRFVGGVSALAPKAFLCDKDASESDGPVVGQSVWAIVQSVDVDKARMVLNLRKSAVDRLLGTGAAASKKRGGSSNIDDAAATRKTKAARGDADAATADARADVPATSLTIGMTVQCRIEPSELAISDASGLDSTLPASKAALMVTLLGVSGRYKARLGLAECCDVCPFTGKVSNAEGFETFKRLAASFSADAAPVFRAKVIAVRTGKLKERAPGSDAPSKQREALVELELSIRPSELRLGEACVAFPRPALSARRPADSVAGVVPVVPAQATNVTSAGFVQGSWCWGVLESQSTEWLVIGLGGGVRGRMHVLEADRGSSSSPLDQAAVLNDVVQGRRFAPGSSVLCVVLKVDVANKQLLLSGHRAPAAISAAAAVLRKPGAAVDANAASRAALVAACQALGSTKFVPGACVFAQVLPASSAAAGKLTMRVAVSPEATAGVCVTHSADRPQWASQPFSKFFAGQVVHGVLLPQVAVSKFARRQHADDCGAATDGSSSDETDSRKVITPARKSKHARFAMSLRPSWIALAQSAGADAAAALVDAEAAERASVRVVGSIVSGFVEAATSKGCFIRLCRGVTARSLLKDLADSFVKDVAAAFPCAKLVAGRILAVDEPAHQIDISLKGSVVTGVRTLVGSAAAPGGAASDSDDSASDSSADVESVPIGALGKRASRGASELSDEDDVSTASDAGSSDSEADDEEVVTFRAAPVPGLKRRKFDWDAKEANSGSEADEDAQLWKAAAGASGQREDATSGRRARASAKKRLESETDAQEKRLAADDFVPESALDFERLVLASPNSSVVWIRYMAFQLSITEIEGARAVAERALKAISFRDEQEKMNIWVAFLNLEHTYGDAASLSALFHRALQHNNPKKIHAHMLSMYEARGKVEEANALYRIATRKFPGSKQFWVNWGAFQMKSGDADGARATLTRALTLLPRRKHVAAILKFALLEYKHGFTERGRTIFEGLLSSEPKRLDLWNVYVDQEIACGEIDNARRLLERAVHLKLSTKKVKFFFKKFLSFEAAHGTPDTVQHVRDAAKAYVDALTS